MAIKVFRLLQNGQLDFSLEFENIIFAIVPASCVLLAVILAGASSRPWRSRGQHSNLRAVIQYRTVLAILTILHAISLGLYCRHLNASALFSVSGTAAYILRLIASSFVLVHLFLRIPGSELLRDIYLLATCVADGFRLHTLWSIAQQPGEPTGIALPALQSAVAVVSGIALILSEVFSNFTVRAARKKADPAHVDEPGSGVLGMLFFGWLWPLLQYGRKSTIAFSDVESAIARSTATFKLGSEWMSTMDDEGKFLAEISLHFVGAVVIQILGAGATLAQPFIVQGIVSYLQNEQNKSFGIWLVIAMVFDQLAISLLEAHGTHAFNQLSFKIRSFLIHKIALRSLSGSPPADGWNAAGDKVLVHVSQDSVAIAGAVQLLGMIIPNIFVIGIGSYMLFRLINVAFLGALLSAIACTVLPMLLARPLSRSQRNLLEATERRITSAKHLISEVRSLRFGNMQHAIESQATRNRGQEITAAATFRRILTLVVVAAVFLSSLATLASFGGFSLLPRHNLDYTVLFTSLSTMQIMLTPLLSIIQMLPEFVSSLVSWDRLASYTKTSQEDMSRSKSPQNPSSSSGKSTSPQHTVIDMVSLATTTRGIPLTMENVTAEWASGSACIEHVSLSLGVGCLAIVAGAAGSGKSSFLKTVLGESAVAKGRISVGAHKLSLCDQTLWFIPEETIKENIIFGKPFDQRLYDKVIACCCLDRDLRALDDGGSTKLSIIGSPLSGGQRRRVSLARTLYDCGDLFLLDDIFNGLDAKTRAMVATNIFGPSGFIQEIGAAAILVCTEPPNIMFSFPRTEFYLMQNGHLNVLEKGVIIENEMKDERSQDFQSVQPVTSTGVSLSDKSEGQQSSSAGEEHVVDVFSSSEKAKTLRAHRAYFKSFGSPIIVTIAGVFLFAWAGLDRAGSFWLSHWASQYSSLGHDVDNGYYIGIYVAVSVASVLAMFISVWITFMHIVPESSVSLHRDMLSVLAKTPAYTIEQHKSETINRFANDIEAVDLHLPQALQNLITAIASCIGSIVIIGIGSPYTMISLPILLPLIFILQRFYLRTSFQLRSLQVATQAPILQMVSAMLEGRITIRAFNQEQYMARLMSAYINQGLMMGYLFRSVQVWVTLMLGLINGCLAIALTGLLIGLGGSNGISWGGLALVNIIRLGQDAMLLLTWWTRFESTMASMDRICDYTERMPQEHVQIPEARVGGAWPECGRIQLKDLSLAYRSRQIIKGLSIDIPAGTKVAILGRTGSGKTSLLQSFFGLIHHTGGTLEVDGVNISSVPSDAVRLHLVGHSQNFAANPSVTVRENLDIDGRVADPRIQCVLSSLAETHMAEDIMSKLDSKWSECNFSDGWQRIIGLARTLLRDSNVYIMDEPTSGMDEQSHIAAMEAIFDLLAEKTVITTTHTLVGIAKFDDIIIIDDGNLVEQGSPTTLLANEGSMLSQLLRDE